MLAQILAVGIFLAMFLLILLDRFPRHLVTLSCALATLIAVFGLCMRSSAAVREALSLYSIVRPQFWYTGRLRPPLHRH